MNAAEIFKRFSPRCRNQILSLQILCMLVLVEWGFKISSLFFKEKFLSRVFIPPHVLPQLQPKNILFVVVVGFHKIIKNFLCRSLVFFACKLSHRLYESFVFNRSENQTLSTMLERKVRNICRLINLIKFPSKENLQLQFELIICLFCLVVQTKKNF